jgi:hypothetical protein
MHEDHRVVRRRVQQQHAQPEDDEGREELREREHRAERVPATSSGARGGEKNASASIAPSAYLPRHQGPGVVRRMRARASRRARTCHVIRGQGW